MDVIAEPTWKCLRRLAEVSTHSPLEAFDKDEEMAFNNLIQYQMNKRKKCHQPSLQGQHTLGHNPMRFPLNHNPKSPIEEIKDLVQIRLRALISGMKSQSLYGRLLLNQESASRSSICTFSAGRRLINMKQ